MINYTVVIDSALYGELVNPVSPQTDNLIALQEDMIYYSFKFIITNAVGIVSSKNNAELCKLSSV